jgi:hypothetical protein
MCALYLSSQRSIALGVEVNTFLQQCKSGGAIHHVLYHKHISDLSKQQRTATVLDETKIVPVFLFQNRLKRGYVGRSCRRNQGFVRDSVAGAKANRTSSCLHVFYSCGRSNTRATETVEEAGLLSETLSGRFHAGFLRFIVVTRDTQVIVLISHAHTAEVSGSGTLGSTAVRGTASATATVVKRAQPQ